MMKTTKLIAAISLVFMLGACSKVNKENYDSIKMGMEFKEVVTKIGEPETCSETLGTKSCQWGDDKKGISVTFIANKATVFSNKGL